MPRPWSQRGLQAALSNGKSEGGRRTGATTKSVCPNCQHTICVLQLGDEQVITDSELVTVVADRGGSKRERVTARRLHAESCARLARQAEKERLRAERDRYDARRAPVTLANIDKVSEDLRREYTATQASLRQLRQRAAGVAPKRGTRGRGM